MQLVKKFPAFHGTRRLITALTSVRHLSLSWASPVQSIYPHPTSWRSILTSVITVTRDSNGRRHSIQTISNVNSTKAQVFSYSDTRHTNSQQTNSAVCTGAKLHYVQLVHRAVGPGSSGSHLKCCIVRLNTLPTLKVFRLVSKTHFQSQCGANCSTI